MKNYKKVLGIIVLIIAVFIGGFFIFSTETSTKETGGSDIKSRKSNDVKLCLLDASRNDNEVNLNYDVEFGEVVKVDYDSVSFGDRYVEEPGVNNSRFKERSTHWSSILNKEDNKINIEHSTVIEGKIGDKQRLCVEDIILKKTKQITHRLDFNEDSVEIKVNSNIVEKIVLKKPKVYDDEMVVKARIYSKKNNYCGVWMNIYDGDEKFDSTRSGGNWEEENVTIKKFIFELGNHDIKDLVLEISYEEWVKEIKGKWSVDFQVDNKESDDLRQVKDINKKLDLGDYSFLIDKAEKNSRDINIYTSNLKSSIHEKHMVDWNFHQVNFIYPKLKQYKQTWVDRSFNNNNTDVVLTLGLFDEEMKKISLDNLKLNFESIEKEYKVCEDYSECDLVNLKNISKEEKTFNSEIRGEPIEIKYKRVGKDIELELISDKDKLLVHSIQLLNKEGKKLEDDKVKTIKWESPLELKDRYVQHITLEKTELEEINFVIDNYSEIVQVNKEIVVE